MENRRQPFWISLPFLILCLLALSLYLAIWARQGFAQTEVSESKQASEKFPGGEKKTSQYEDGSTKVIETSKDHTIREDNFFYPNGKPKWILTEKINPNVSMSHNYTAFDKNSHITEKSKTEYEFQGNVYCPVVSDSEEWKYDEKGRVTQYVKVQSKEGESNGTFETTTYKNEKDKTGTTLKKKIHWDRERVKWVDEFGIVVEEITWQPGLTQKCLKKTAESQPVKPEKTSVSPPQENNIRQFEFFGGYAFMHASGEAADNLNGWNVEFAANIRQPVGVVADFSGGYGSVSEDLPGGGTADTTLRRHLFLVGAQFSFPQVPRVTPFAHALLGAALDSNKTTLGAAQTSSTVAAFAMALGGGLDLRINSRVNWRPIQTDYLLTAFGGSVQNNFRLSTGFVFLFGKPMAWGSGTKTETTRTEAQVLLSVQAVYTMYRSQINPMGDTDVKGKAYRAALAQLTPEEQTIFVNYLDNEIRNLREQSHAELEPSMHSKDPITEQERIQFAAQQFGLANLSK
ncbi:MAG: hypothetical protein U1F66_09325 [bacterium]